VAEIVPGDTTVPTFYLIVHRSADGTPTSAKVTDEASFTRKYLDRVAREAARYDLTISSRSDSGITFADGKSVAVTPIA
jgi:hypothetical protein